jgi:hypothetical protein
MTPPEGAGGPGKNAENAADGKLTIDKKCVDKIWLLF